MKPKLEEQKLWENTTYYVVLLGWIAASLLCLEVDGPVGTIGAVMLFFAIWPCIWLLAELMLTVVFLVIYVLRLMLGDKP